MNTKRITQGLTNNWTLKLFSLLVSLVLFLFVSFDSGNTKVVKFPVTFEPDDDIMVLNEADYEWITATLQGPMVSFRSFADPQHIVINLSSAQPGPLQTTIDETMIPAGAGMTVIELNPAKLELELDRKVEKLIKVEVDPLGRPAFGFDLAKLTAEPTHVRVEGPLTRIRLLNFVHTRPVDLQDRTEDFETEVELQAPRRPLRLLDRSSVDVFVDVTEEVTKRTLSVRVQLDPVVEGATLQEEAVSVTLEGPRRFIDRLDPAAMVALVDVKRELAAGATRLEKAVTLTSMPDRSQVVGQLPTVKVTLPRRRQN